MEVVRPDGTKDVLGPFMADPTGGSYTSYIPAKVGNYTIQAFYPGQILTGTNPLYPAPGSNLQLIGSYMKPSVSEKLAITVQEEPVPLKYKTPPLPTEYWSRPIYATNWDWAKLGGNWFGVNNVQLYTTAPNTGHILWTKPTQFGGQPGAPHNSDQQSQYLSQSLIVEHFEPTTVLNGILYYHKYASLTGKIVGWAAVELRTGETLWERSAGETGSEPIVLGQILQTHTIQEYGATSYLWSFSGGVYRIYDPMTGVYLFNITGATSLSFIVDFDCIEQGTLLGWGTSGNNLYLWNSTQLMYYPTGPRIEPDQPGYNPNYFRYGRDLRPSGNISFSSGIQWTVPRNFTIAGKSTGALGIGARTPEVILLYSAPTIATRMSAGYQIAAGIDAKTGKLLWGPLNQTLPEGEDIGVRAAGDGVYVLTSKTTNEAYGYSLKNGENLWGPVNLKGNALSRLSSTAAIAYGNVYIADFGGFVNALDLQTGEIKWTFTRGSSGYDTPFGVYPIWYFSKGSICDGKIFLPEGKEYDPPLFPGAQELAINATTGELVWSILGWMAKTQSANGDGMLVQWNSYDSQIYTFGKGQTVTTVEASPEVSVHGSSVLVKGMVTDEAPGTKNADRIARFPNGVPAVSDESMSDWMEYVYMQQPRPANATGVEVILSALDPNNNSYEVGRATSDANGMYKLKFEPEVPGAYTLIATFPGSESYWPSVAETAFVVEDAPVTIPIQNEPISFPPTEMYIGIATGLIILAIAVVGLLLFRKR